MGSSLGSILADIFMVELNNNLVPNLHQHLSRWRRYVATTLSILEVAKMEHVLLILNSCQRNFKITYEKKNNNRLLILDVLFMQNYDEINTTIYRKSTLESIYTCYLKKGALHAP